MTATATPESVGATPRNVIATSDWHGSFRGGSGSISTGGPTLQQAPYTYASRFDGEAGACPEELLAAAHAACLNHAVANISEILGAPVESIHTTVRLTMGRDQLGPAIVAMHATVEASGPASSASQFADVAERALVNCAISKALRIEPTLTANWKENRYVDPSRL
jgi:lipoyl-dependent peroxiredoxin